MGMFVCVYVGDIGFDLCWLCAERIVNVMLIISLCYLFLLYGVWCIQQAYLLAMAAMENIDFTITQAIFFDDSCRKLGL